MRTIALICGPSGSGKSFFCANLPKALIYDTDIGGGLSYADKRIKNNGSIRVECSTYEEILSDLKSRNSRGELDSINTLVIDHLTIAHQSSIEKWNPDFKKDYGRSVNLSSREWLKIREYVRNFDFNLICTSHLKALYKNEVQVGWTADASKNVEADFGIIVHLSRKDYTGTPTAKIRKVRIDPDEAGDLPEDGTFEFNVENFIRIFRLDMSLRVGAQSIQEETKEKILKLVHDLGMSDGDFLRLLKKARVDDISDMTEKNALLLLEHLEKKRG